MSLPNEEKTYLALPTDSWDCESIVGSYPLDSLEVVDSEFDIDGISRIVYDNFGYCLFQRLAVPRIAVHRIAMLRFSLPILSVVPIITQLTSMAVLALPGHQVTDPAQVGKPLSQGLQHPPADVILPLGVGELLIRMAIDNDGIVSSRLTKSVDGQSSVKRPLSSLADSLVSLALNLILGK